MYTVPRASLHRIDGSSTNLRHFQSCLRLLRVCARVLLCALCQNRALSCDPLLRPRHRQALADQNILCTEGLPSTSGPHVPNTPAVEGF
jgi:hypothetical protein